jgi:hypothetical protein
VRNRWNRGGIAEESRRIRGGAEGACASSYRRGGVGWHLSTCRVGVVCCAESIELKLLVDLPRARYYLDGLLSVRDVF